MQTRRFRSDAIVLAKYRKIVEIIEHEGLSNKEACIRMGVHPPSFPGFRRRAERLLKKEMEFEELANQQIQTVGEGYCQERRVYRL